MFSDELKNISWQETTRRIASMTASDVERALRKEHCDVTDFMALLSPAAEPYLEQMARLSRQYTEERFGKTMSMFIPLYITNACSNSCVYCGFHRENPMARTILTPEQIENEYKAIKQLAPFENILLVTGEHPAKAGVPYIAEAVDLAKKYFSNVKIEVMPLSAEDYKTLADHGMNGVICFQETYNSEHYKLYHPRGMKSRFEWRCDGFDRMGQAGVHSIGMGVLIGLEKEWRTDVVIGSILFFCEITHVHIHLPDVLMLHGILLQVYQHKAFQYAVVEHEVYMVVAVGDGQRVLASYIGESLAQFQQECLQVVYQPLLQVAFAVACLLGQTEKLQGIGVLYDVFGALQTCPFIGQLQYALFVFAGSETQIERTVHLAAQRAHIPVLGYALLLVEATLQVIVYRDKFADVRPA